MLDQLNQTAEVISNPSVALMQQEVEQERKAASAAPPREALLSTAYTLDIKDPFASKDLATKSIHSTSSIDSTKSNDSTKSTDTTNPSSTEHPGDTTKSTETTQSGDSKNEKPTDKLPGRFDNTSIVQASDASRQTGLPLVVQIGESWCPHCHHMDTDVWPNIEGAEGKPGSLQGKAIFLHLDFDKSKSLTGDAGEIASDMREDMQGFPTFRIYKISPDNTVSFISQAVGELSQADLEKFLTSNGVAK